MAKSPFQYNPTLTGIALAYSNPAYTLIADQVLPRTQVATEAFEYLSFPVEDQYTVPDTRVGRTSKVNQIEFGGTKVGSSTEDYGLEDPIPSKDMTNAANSRVGYDPQGKAVEYLTNLILLDREVRTAGVVFNAANYPTNNKTTLSGTGQWSDYANSDPVAAILDARDLLLIPGNTLVLGQQVWTKLKQHPKVISKVLGSANSIGMVSRQAFMDALEIPRLAIGQSFVNTARKGQAGVMARTWGKHASILFIDEGADTNRGITFGYTAEFENRIAGTIMDDPDIGLRGGIRVRVGMSVKEMIAASNLGYFWQNAIA
jgi:hypothetical protein